MTDRQEIRDSIVQSIIDAFSLRNTDRNEFDDTTQLVEEGIIDSSGLLEVITFIEETYEFEVSDDDMATSFFSVKSIVDYVVTRLKTKEECA